MSGLEMSTAEQFLFWIIGPITVLGASALLFSKRSVLTACSVMVTMVGLAFLYVGLGSPFLGIVQVVVYTGAIMMLFVFVLMLVGVDVSDSFTETIRGQRWIGVIFGLGLLVVLAGAVWRSAFTFAVGAEAASEGNNAGAVASLLFSDYAFTLEITGCLLIVAAMGAVILTHRVRLTKPVTQPQIMAARTKGIERGLRLTPLPAPGNYARHNAADAPATDAAGKIIEDSVPSSLRLRGQVHTLRGLSQDLLEGGPPTIRRPDVVPPPLEQPAIDAAGDPAEPDAPPTAAGDQTASDATELEAASPPGAPTAAGDPAEPEGQPETAGDQTGSGKDDGQAGETGETEVTP